MPDALAVIRQKSFEGQARQEWGASRPGEGPIPWFEYERRNPALDNYLQPGDRLWLVTARPGGALWLVAVYENVRLRNGRWEASTANRVRVTDITQLKRKLKFHRGHGLIRNNAKLGNSLQMPRLLTAEDLVLLEKAVKHSVKGTGKLAEPKHAPIDPKGEAKEGKKIRLEIERYSRNPALVTEVLRRDKERCQHCGFSVARTCNLNRMRPVVHVHHIQPLHDRGASRTKVDQLVTLCPTCHFVAHAIANALGSKEVGLSLLKRHYRPS